MLMLLLVTFKLKTVVLKVNFTFLLALRLIKIKIIEVNI